MCTCWIFKIFLLNEKITHTLSCLGIFWATFRSKLIHQFRKFKWIYFRNLKTLPCNQSSVYFIIAYWFYYRNFFLIKRINYFDKIWLFSFFSLFIMKICIISLCFKASRKNEYYKRCVLMINAIISFSR